MNRYRFVISANGFELAVLFATHEESGLKWCKRYMGQFQRRVANVQMKVAIFMREKQPENWMYHKKPYEFQRNMIKKPIDTK